MSYVSISKPVNDRIVRASQDTQTEIIGLLLGRLESDTIIIEDSITGEFSGEADHVTLPSSTLAKIANDLVSGRTKGNIVGWYHSHTEGGLFFSETDVETQKKLQQFSSFVTAMVVDASTGNVGYFRVEAQTGKTLRIADERIRIYQKASEAVQPEAKIQPIVRPTPTLEVRRQLRGEKTLPLSRLVIAILLIAVVASAAIIGAVLYRGPGQFTGVTINYSSIPNGTIGTPIEVKANVTGAVRNVTLFYTTPEATSFTETTMNHTQLGIYQAEIPGDQVTGRITYYIKATDMSGNPVQTGILQVPVSDFAIIAKTPSVTVYRNQSVLAELTLFSINDFGQQLSLSTESDPSGLTTTFSPNPTAPGTQVVSMNIADSNTHNGTYPIVVLATYSPPQSPPITHQATVTVTVADFELQVSPTSKQISAGGSTAYAITLTVQRGFADPISVKIQGLPSTATYQLTLSPNTIMAGPGTITATLQVTTTTNTQSGTYNLIMTAIGAGINHRANIQLIVR